MPNDAMNLLQQLQRNPNPMGIPSKDTTEVYRKDSLAALQQIQDNSKEQLTETSLLIKKIDSLVKKDTPKKSKKSTKKEKLTGTTKDADKGGKKRLSGTTVDADKNFRKEKRKELIKKSIKAPASTLAEKIDGWVLPGLVGLIGIFGDSLTKGLDKIFGQLGNIVSDPRFFGPVGAYGAYKLNQIRKRFFPGKAPTTPKPTPKPTTPKAKTPTKKPLVYSRDAKGKLQVESSTGKKIDVDSPKGKMIETRGGTQNIDDAIKQRPKKLTPGGPSKTAAPKVSNTKKVVEAAKKTGKAAKAGVKTGLRGMSKALGPIGILLEAGLTVSDAIDIMSSGGGEKLEAYRKQFDESSPVWKAITAISSPAYFSAMMGENLAEWAAGDYKTDLADKKMTKPKARYVGSYAPGGMGTTIQPTAAELKEYENWKKAVEIKNNKINDIVKWTSNTGEPITKADLQKLPYSMIARMHADIYNMLGGDKVLNPEKAKQKEEISRQNEINLQKAEQQEMMDLIQKLDANEKLDQNEINQLEKLRQFNDPSNPYYQGADKAPGPAVQMIGGPTINITQEPAPQSDKYSGKDN